MPLRTGIVNPENSLDDLASWNRLVTRATGRYVPFRKVLPDAFPLYVAWFQHAADDTRCWLPGNVEIASGNMI